MIKRKCNLKIAYCLICKKKFLFRPFNKTGKYCSIKCSAKSRIGKSVNITWGDKISLAKKKQNLIGKKSIRWKGGKIIKHNRIYIYSPNHLFKNNQGYVYQYRLIAEKILCRYLTSNEIIHHIDNNTLNDNPKNLYLFPSNSKHISYHNLKNKPELISNLSC